MDLGRSPDQRNGVRLSGGRSPDGARGDQPACFLPELSPVQWPARRRELADAGLALCGLASSVHFHDPEDSAAQLQVETARRYVEMCAELGGDFVRVFGDVLPPATDHAARSDTLNRIADRLRDVGEVAAQAGIKILLETHGDFLQSGTVALLMQKTDHPAVGVLWDTHHPWKFEGEAPEETVSNLAPWIVHTHWKDSVNSAERNPKSDAELAAGEAARALMSGHRDAGYVSFGSGDFPARNCLTALRSCGYRGWYCLEWEKAWHPEIEDPRTIFPDFVSRFKTLWNSLST
ncbi:MAG: sugar phosphate isomerase/epimerase family protein [Planctomycetales bacterium]